MDRKKVMTWLEICGKNRDCSATCPYGDGSLKFEYTKCIEDLMADALALLKEQETVEGHWIPIESPTGVEAFGIKEMTAQVVRCSVCDAEEDVSFAAYRFCPRCGAKMDRR